jgi:hypothetical protein
VGQTLGMVLVMGHIETFAAGIPFASRILLVWPYFDNLIVFNQRL